MVGGVGDRPPHTGAPLRGDIFARAHFFGVVTLDLHPPLRLSWHEHARLAHSAAVRAGVWRVGGGWAVSHLEELMASSFLLLLWVALSPRSVNVSVKGLFGSHLREGRCLKTLHVHRREKQAFCLKVWRGPAVTYSYELVPCSHDGLFVTGH